MQHYVDERFPDRKHFTALKIINTMGKFEKRIGNLNANMNNKPVFFVYFSIKGHNFSMICKTTLLVILKCSTHFWLSYCMMKQIEYQVMFIIFT
jgi:hypothetical protein